VPIPFSKLSFILFRKPQKLSLNPKKSAIPDFWCRVVGMRGPEHVVGTLRVTGFGKSTPPLSTQVKEKKANGGGGRSRLEL